MFVFYFNMKPRLEWNKIILAAKIHFRRHVIHAQTFLFHFRRGSMLK